MKIGVFGDSFADHNMGAHIESTRNNESWIQCLKDKGYDIESFGVGGTSCWYSYRKFLRNYQNYSHIVFAFSSIHRIHSLPNALKSFSVWHGPQDKIQNSPMFQQLEQESQQQYLKITAAYEYMNDTELNKFIVQNIFNAVNRLSNHTGKKIVNLLSFFDEGNHDNFDLDDRKGPCITGLNLVSMKEMPDLFTKSYLDSRFCHLSDTNNRILADMIIDCFNSGSNEIIDGFNSGKFVYDSETAKRYYEMGGIR